jgi:hypothetical protein
VILNAVLDYLAPLPPVTKDLNYQVTKQFLINSLIEGVAITLFTALSCYVAASKEVRKDFIKNAIIVFAADTALRSVATTCRYAAIVDGEQFFRSVSLIVDCLAPIFFSESIHSVHHVVHEGAHVLSTYLLSKTSTIKVSARSILLWSTTSDISLGRLGNYLGESYSLSVIAAAGPFASVVISQIKVIFALCFKKSYPELSKYLFFSALRSLRGEVVYAREALNTTNPFHDFNILWKIRGIHPYVFIAIMIAIPLISTAACVFVQHREQILRRL